MNKTMKEILKMFDCKDVESTTERFLNDDDFYFEATEMVLKDEGFERLKEQLDSKDTKASFETAHMLKGIIANCSITPLYNLIVKIVESLRNGNPDYDELIRIYNELINERNKIKEKLL